MANPVKGEVSFDAAGASHTLVYDFNALCTIEEEFGVDASGLDEHFGANGPKARDLRKLFRIGMSRHSPDITDEEAGDVITELGPIKAGELIGQAFKLAYPTAEGKGAARPQKRRSAGTG